MTDYLSTLPYDVWTLLLPYIPSEDLQRLYSVNKALFYFSMAERYKLVRLTHPDQIGTKNCLQRVSDDVFRSGMARVLKLRLGPFGDLIPKSKKFDWAKRLPLDGPLESIYLDAKHGRGQRRTRFMKSPGMHPADVNESLDLLQALVSAISGLTQVQECVLDYYHDVGENTIRSFKIAVPFVLAGWRAFGDSLTTLRLETFPLEALSLVLSEDLKFSRLRTLDVQVFLIYRSSDPASIMTSSLVPFINNHCDTIQTLRLQTTQHLPLNPVFASLRPLPLLRDLAVTQGYVSTLQSDTRGLHAFLVRQVHSLSSLALTLHALGTNLVKDPLMGDLFNQPFLNVKFPLLTRLSIGFLDFPDDVPTRMRGSYLPGFWDSITHLEVSMKLQGLSGVVALLSEVPKCNKLRSLSLVVGRVVPGMWEELSRMLPRLWELELEMDAFHSGDEDASDFVIETIEMNSKFQAAMASRTCLAWELQHLAIRFPFPRRGGGDDTPQMRSRTLCFKAILQALPALQTFNGSLRGRYLSRCVIASEKDPVILGQSS